MLGNQQAVKISLSRVRVLRNFTSKHSYARAYDCAKPRCPIRKTLTSEGQTVANGRDLDVDCVLL